MKLKNIKFMVFTILLTYISCFIGTKVYAKTITPDEVEAPAYVIGSHVFTRNVNETTGYDGKLTTSLIMLASKTIEKDDLDSMIIYYKTSSGKWINGLNGLIVNPPETFEINYTDMQLEKENSVDKKPNAPVIDLNDGPLSIDDESDMFSYQLNIYIDDINNNSNKIDGVELQTVINGVITTNDLEYEKNFSTVVTVSDSYDGNKLQIGKQYHESFITFKANPYGYYSVTAKSYIKDKNGKKIYSDTVFVSDKDVVSKVQIVNNYSEPDYISKNNNYYTYSLSFKNPKAYVYKVKPEKFVYIVNEKGEKEDLQIGIFRLNDIFNISVKSEDVKTYYANIGYYDKNGELKIIDGNSEKEYFTIDTRTLTKPVLSVTKEGISFSELKNNGEYLSINSDFYKKQKEETLDYNIEGVEIYRVYFISGVPYYELVSEKGETIHVFPPNGADYYAARVYAKNKVGKKIYSEFSDIITAVRTPEISMSKVIDGNVDINIVNIDDYSALVSFNVYSYDSNNKEILLGTFKLSDKKININVTENTDVYVRAYSEGYESSELNPTYVYSAKSNVINTSK